MLFVIVVDCIGVVGVVIGDYCFDLYSDLMFVIDYVYICFVKWLV